MKYIHQEVDGKMYTIGVDSDDPRIIKYAEEKLKKDIHNELVVRPRWDKWKAEGDALRKEVDIAEREALRELGISYPIHKMMILKEYVKPEQIIMEGDFTILYQVLPGPVVDMMHEARRTMHYSTLRAYWDAQDLWVKHMQDYPSSE